MDLFLFTFNLSLNSAPEVVLQQLECKHPRNSHTSLKCTVDASGGCATFNGKNLTINWNLKGGPTCNASHLIELHEPERFNLKTNRHSHTFYSLVAYATYTITVDVGNEVGPGASTSETFTTPHNDGQ